MSLSWSPQQREWLQALGHPLMVLAADRPIASAAADEPPLAPQEREAVAARPPQSGHSAGPGLHRALLRATGLPATEAEQALRSLDVDATVLRGDPAAKRRLWSRLRRLRVDRST